MREGEEPVTEIAVSSLKKLGKIEKIEDARGPAGGSVFGKIGSGYAVLSKGGAINAPSKSTCGPICH